MKDLTPNDHAEAVATFRHAVIGPACAHELSHGDLAEALREISRTRVRPPNSGLTVHHLGRRTRPGRDGHHPFAHDAIFQPSRQH